MRELKRLLRGVINRKKIFVRKKAPKMNPADAKRLHLGCGNIRLEGFCNVDILMTPAVDVVSDISKLDNFSDNSIDLIYACHVLEHFSHNDVINVMPGVVRPRLPWSISEMR